MCAANTVCVGVLVWVRVCVQVEQTASSVLSMFPDLELAVEEGEPQLAVSLFNMAKSWIADLRVLVNETQKINKASMFQVSSLHPLNAFMLVMHLIILLSILFYCCNSLLIHLINQLI